MNKYAEEYRRYYPFVFDFAIIFLILAGYLIIRSDKPRDRFLHQKGTIAYLSQVHPLQEEGEIKPKKFYLVIAEYKRIFELFIGTDTGDFSPRVNRVKELKVGDEVDIYFEENTKPINKLLQYLDKDGTLYFLRNRADQYVGGFIILCSGLLIIIGAYMKKTIKIE